MNKDAEINQRILVHLLSFLDRNEAKSVSANSKLKSIWDSGTENVEKFRIRHCLVEMLELQADVLRIAKDLEPYKDDAIPVLIEALNLKKSNEAFMFSNARDVLEIIGDDRVIPLILEKFDEHLKDYHVFGLLMKIGARGTDETRMLIGNHLTTYLSVERDVHPSWVGKYKQDVEHIIDALRVLGQLQDSRLPTLLGKHIQKAPYNSQVCQKALLALADIDATQAVALVC